MTFTYALLAFIGLPPALAFAIVVMRARRVITSDLVGMFTPARSVVRMIWTAPDTASGHLRRAQ